MPTLTKTDDELQLSLSGSRDFEAALDAVKAVPGRRFDGDTKLWKFPADPALAERLLMTVKPSSDQSILNWVRQSRSEREKELSTKLPDDADLLIPWGDKLYDFQRACVWFLARHPKAIEADDMGLGKSLQALSAVYEYLLHLASEQNGNTIDSLCNSGAETPVLSEVSRGEPREGAALEQAVSEGAAGSLEQDDPGRETEAMRGLRTERPSSASNGLGSRPRAQAVHVRQLSDVSLAAWNIKGRGDSIGAKEVRSALSDVPQIAALAARPKLIICPNSAKGVWGREIEKWLGTEEPYVLVDAKTPKKRTEQIERGIAQAGWVVVNYEQIRAAKTIEKMPVNHRDGTSSVREKVTYPLKQPLFGETEWLAVIADECHRAKNRKAAQTMGLWQIDAPMKLALSGTPMMNAPDELWAILKWLYPEQYGNSDPARGAPNSPGYRPGHPRTAYWSFHDQYTESYEGYNNSKVVVGVKNPDALRFELKDRLIRRTKVEKLNLPEKVRHHIPVTLNPSQQKLYSEAEAAFWLQIEQAIKAGDEKLAADVADVIAGKKRILEIQNGAARTVRLRQIACSPALLGGEDDSAKLDAIVDKIVDNNHLQHVVFTEFVQGANLLVDRLRKKKLTSEAFTGEVADTRVRTHYEDRFQSGEIQVLVGTLSAMREAVTLTAASTVHFCERAWVPGWNEQAEDRLWRNGQENRVLVLIYEGVDSVDTQKVRPTLYLKENIVSSVLKKDTIQEKEFSV